MGPNLQAAVDDILVNHIIKQWGDYFVPTISIFYGIVISMFYNDHAPPHFHAKYAEFKGIIDIQQLEMLKGNLPRRALELVLDWAELHQSELLIDWNLCQKKQVPHKIEPLN